MSKKPDPIGIGSSEPASGSARILAELEVEGVGKFPIDRVATIGRSPDSQVVLNVRSVSRHHARIFYEGGHFWIKDLESGNGTSVNAKRVTLQMLSDNDKVCFGEANCVFRTSTQVPGPAPLARDPLEGSDALAQDGTPTGGLRGVYPNLSPGRAREGTSATLDNAAVGPGGTTAGAATENPAVLRSQIEALEKENERLQKLVSRLEHTLADANIRIRNLQQRLDRSSSGL